jgi:H+/Cl- antiporter ClcA
MKILNVTIQKLKDRHFEESLLFISIGIFSALLCSAYAKFFSATELFSSKFFSSHPELLFIASPLGLIIAFLLIRWVAPGASGSGIPQVMACIEKEQQHLASILLRKTVIVIKIISSLIAVLVGAAIGREGPSLQISASIAYNLSLFLKRFNIKVKVEQVLAAGAASGLAAAFNTPIGGIVYAIEEISKEHVKTFKDVLLLAVVISGITAQLIMGNYLYLGYPTVPSDYGLNLLAAIAVLSILCGILGGLFSKTLFFLIQWRSKQSFTNQLFIIALVGIALASMFYLLGDQSLYSGKETINHALFSKEEMPWNLTLARFFAPLISSMTGIAGGIFAPSLSAGSAIGSQLAQLFDPSMKTIFALVGMVGFLTGVTHTPITSFILVLEMTDRHSVVLPMMIAAVFSSLGAHLISNKSFYEEALEKILDTEKRFNK